MLHWLNELSTRVPFGIKTTEAPHFRRVMAQSPLVGDVSRRRHLRAPRAVNDGNGFVFIDHLGRSCPAGFCRWGVAT